MRFVSNGLPGSAPEFMLFWRETPKVPGSIDAACFSQWFPAPFVIDGVRYSTAEHFMMAEKARLFGDAATLEKILAAPSSGAAKALGRVIVHYDDAQWSAARFDVVVRGSIAKFGQNDRLRTFLLETGEKIPAEASPTDTIWGIGLAASDERARDPMQWRGLSLLGFALVEARRQLRA